MLGNGSCGILPTGRNIQGPEDPKTLQPKTESRFGALRGDSIGYPRLPGSRHLHWCPCRFREFKETTWMPEGSVRGTRVGAKIPGELALHGSWNKGDPLRP